MFCKLKKRNFDDYIYASCLWSGDGLPVCPHCGQSPYEFSFKEFHTEAAKRQDDEP